MIALIIWYVDKLFCICLYSFIVFVFVYIHSEDKYQIWQLNLLGGWGGDNGWCKRRRYFKYGSNDRGEPKRGFKLVKIIQEDSPSWNIDCFHCYWCITLTFHQSSFQLLKSMGVFMKIFNLICMMLLICHWSGCLQVIMMIMMVVMMTMDNDDDDDDNDWDDDEDILRCDILSQL